jgi:deoxyadenosine/deoxycytidine kinase
VGYRIEICGPMASGKTLIATALGHLWPTRPRVLLERYDDILFWRESWLEPGVFDFERDLGFLLYHYHALRTLPNEEQCICDFAFFEDLAYAKLSKNEADVRLLEQLYEKFLARIPWPALIVNLTCPVQVLMERIAARGRPEEAFVSEEFVARLTESITAELATLERVTGVPVVTIDTSEDGGLRSQRRIKAICSRIMNELKQSPVS